MVRFIPVFLAIALLVALMGVALVQSGITTLTPMTLSSETLGGLPIDVVSFGGSGGARK